MKNTPENAKIGTQPQFDQQKDPPLSGTAANEDIQTFMRSVVNDVVLDSMRVLLRRENTKNVTPALVNSLFDDMHTLNVYSHNFKENERLMAASVFNELSLEETEPVSLVESAA